MQPRGTKKDGIDEVLAELRVSLDILAEVLREDPPIEASTCESEKLRQRLTKRKTV